MSGSLTRRSIILRFTSSKRFSTFSSLLNSRLSIWRGSILRFIHPPRQWDWHSTVLNYHEHKHLCTIYRLLHQDQEQESAKSSQICIMLSVDRISVQTQRK